MQGIGDPYSYVYCKKGQWENVGLPPEHLTKCKYFTPIQGEYNHQTETTLFDRFKKNGFAMLEDRSKK
jgi:hypothetical protein